MLYSTVMTESPFSDTTADQGMTKINVWPDSFSKETKFAKWPYRTFAHMQIVDYSTTILQQTAQQCLRGKHISTFYLHKVCFIYLGFIHINFKMSFNGAPSSKFLWKGCIVTFNVLNSSVFNSNRIHKAGPSIKILSRGPAVQCDNSY